MAQIKSALGIIRGKVGNNIFAKRGKTNVVYLQGKDTNDSSTDPQILVRARMRPASSTYQKLQQILNHSFNRHSVLLSRNDFMSYALRAEFFPYIEKGYVGAAIPGDYRITAGALNTITAQVDSEGIRTNIVVPAGAVMTGASIVKAEENADMIEAKDQLTWIMFGVDAYDTPRWFYTRTNIENTEDPLPVSFSASNGFLRIGKPANMKTVLAGCVIRTNLGNTFMYSSEKLELNEDLYTEKYMSSITYTAMLKSYKKGTTTQSSDLYLDELAGDQPDTDSLPKYTTKLVSVLGKFGAPTDEKNYWAQVYAVSFAGKQYILTGTDANGEIICVSPKGVAQGVKIGAGIVPAKYKYILGGYKNSFAGTWDVGNLVNIGEGTVPAEPFFTIKAQGVDRYVTANAKGTLTGQTSTDLSDALHVTLGEEVEVEAVTASYILNADTLEAIQYEVDTDVFEPLVLRSGVVGTITTGGKPTFVELRMNSNYGIEVNDSEGTPIVYEEVNS